MYQRCAGDLPRVPPENHPRIAAIRRNQSTPWRVILTRQFGGTQVYRWWLHQCPYQFYLWYSGDITEAKPTVLQSLFFEKGYELERRYLDLAKSRASSIVDIGLVEKWSRARATIDAINSGVDLIVHPYFAPPFMDAYPLDVAFIGEADALVRVSGQGGDAGYALVEIKSSRQPKAHHLAQLAYYAHLFEATIGCLPSRTQIVTWDQLETVTPTPRLEDVDIHNELTAVDEFIGCDLPEHATNPKAEFHVNTSCSGCPNRKHCNERVRAEEHLSYLPGIRRKTREQLEMVGITRWPELAAGRTEFEKLKGRCQSSPHVLERLRQQAMSLRSCKQIVLGGLNEHLGVTGQDSLGETAAPAGSPEFTGARIYFDLETDPIAGNATYLFGYLIEEVRQTGALALVSEQDEPANALMNRIEAHCSKWGALQAPVQRIGDPSAETALFEEFLIQMDALRECYGRISIFHYGRFEATQLRALCRRHQCIHNVSERVDRILDESVDLLAVVKASRILPVTSYSLKYVAPCLETITSGEHGHRWDGPLTIDELVTFLKVRGLGDRSSQCIRAVKAAARRHRIDVEEVIAPTAGGSVLWYHEHLAQQMEPIWPLLLNVYNHDDLLAARAVAHWLIDEYRREENDTRLTGGARQ